MKKTILVLTLLISSLSSFLKAQTLDVSWSDKILYDNKTDGFFQDFVGKNSNFLYAEFNKLRLVSRHKAGRLKLVAFDKKTMKKAGMVTVFDTKDAASAKKYKDLVHYKTVVFEHVIYVFWTKESKDKDELFVQTFDSKLKPAQGLKKIYELKSGKKDAKKAELFVMANHTVDETILIGGELASNKGEDIVVEFKVLKSDLTFSSSNQVKLPIIVKYRSNDLSSNYEYGDDGNLHVRTYVSMNKEQRKAAKKGEAHRFPIYTVIDVVSGKVKSYTMRFDNKNIFDFDFVITKDAIKIFGFFCDLNKDPKGDDTHGILYAVLDPESFGLIGEMNFTYFTKSQLTTLFASDKDKRAGKDKKGLFAGKKKKKSEEESIASNYNIEDVQSLDKDNIVVFCSRMYNYSVTTCNDKGQCTTRYYCQKDNVTAFKLDSKGQLVWASNLDRKITYNGWYVWDVKVINKDNKLYAVYGSNYSIKGDKKNMFTAKGNKYKADRFEYAVFDYTTGKYEKKEYKVNAINAKKADKKYMSALNVSVMDNEFYVNSSKIKLKPLSYLSCLCPPVFYFVLLNGNSRRGTGNLGHLNCTK